MHADHATAVRTMKQEKIVTFTLDSKESMPVFVGVSAVEE